MKKRKKPFDKAANVNTVIALSGVKQPDPFEMLRKIQKREEKDSQSRANAPDLALQKKWGLTNIAHARMLSEHSFLVPLLQAAKDTGTHVYALEYDRYAINSTIKFFIKAKEALGPNGKPAQITVYIPVGDSGRARSECKSADINPFMQTLLAIDKLLAAKKGIKPSGQSSQKFLVLNV